MSKINKNLALDKLISSYLGTKGIDLIQTNIEKLDQDIIHFILASDNERLKDILPFYILNLNTNPKSAEYFNVKNFSNIFLNKLCSIWTELQIKTPLSNLIESHLGPDKTNQPLSSQEKDKYYDLFKLYKRNKQELILQKELAKNELAFQHNLSILFSKKQKQIILKKLNNEYLNKTEAEYYSRIIKKKLKAIADSNIFEVAQRLTKN
ncbi:MAG: hypothetical protein ABIA04_15060 [Pseudomonadota bacterium]